MTDFNNNKFKELLDNLDKIIKRILQKRALSKNLTKINEYIKLLIENYNSILDYAKTNSDDVPQNLQESIFLKINKSRQKLIKCFSKLDCKIKIPENINSFVFIDENVMIKSEEDSKNSDLERQESEEDSEQCVLEKLQNINLEDNVEIDIKMATIEQKKSFISMGTSIIRENYDGNPLTLQAFLDKIELIEDLTEPNLQTTFLNFVKSKLEGKAREALPDNVMSVDELKNALRGKIKPDNSKIIAGKIAALNVRNGDYTEFSKQAEELADALKRSLVIEGITKNKAHEMAIEQTITVCRLNAKSDLVKSILASSVFSDPKEVVAKLVIEQTNETKEKQVLAIGQYNRNRNNNFQRNSQSNRFRGNNSYRGNNRGNFHGGNYRRSNGHNFSTNQYQNNYRGNNRNRFSRNNDSQRASVRTLNLEVPQQTTLREEEN